VVLPPLAPVVAMPDKGAMRLGAIILAGGRSARMGRAKDSLPWRGTTLLAHVATTLANCCAPIVVVARDDAQLLPALPGDVARSTDAVAGGGPLAGLLAGLRWHAARTNPCPAVFASACDHPFVNAEVVRWLGDRLDERPDHEAVVVRMAGELQPMVAIWRPSLATTAARLLANGTAGLRDLALAANADFVDADELRAIDPDLACLRDLDTVADYTAARAAADTTPP